MRKDIKDRQKVNFFYVREMSFKIIREVPIVK